MSRFSGRNLWLLSTMILLAGGLASAQDAPRAVSHQELIDELKSAPRSNVERVERLKELYEQAGANPDQIELQPVEGRREDDPLLHNVIVTKPGMTDEVIVVGGHLDKVGVGDGIIDDWSGAALASNLYQSIKNLKTQYTFIFMGFAYEEQGLLGSRKYVGELDDDERARIKAMINLECLGVGGPFIWTNGSNPQLAAFARDVAERHDLTLLDHEIRGVGADSFPFDCVGIPTITFDGLPIDQFHLIHSPQDTFENVDTDRYIAAYELLLRYLVELDRDFPEIQAEEVEQPLNLPRSPE